MKGKTLIIELQLCNNIQYAFFFFLVWIHFCANQPNTTYSETVFCKSAALDKCLNALTLKEWHCNIPVLVCASKPSFQKGFKSPKCYPQELLIFGVVTSLTKLSGGTKKLCTPKHSSVITLKYLRNAPICLFKIY